MNLKGCLALMKAGIIEQIHFRSSVFIIFLGNLIYLLIVYFLWKAIFASSGSQIVNGMTFEDTMIYLVLAMALFNFMEVFLVFNIGRNIQSGKIILDIIKPIPFERYMFFQESGTLVVNFFMTLIPTMVIVYFLTKGAFALGFNLLLFFVSVLMGLVINFSLNFIVATICLYTESVWGINIMKEVIIMLFSGASIPIAFFPEVLKTVVYYLPFQAIYNTPLTILIQKKFSMTGSLKLLVLQLFWLIITLTASHLFWKISLKKITVNGG
ncbi:MAG TPA: ABC-2 family transporter protein [Mobilitalea sp.]|nr:ABC-2 family transporter protein [Mobilitalea sp.]